MRSNRRQQGFTLIEIMVALAVFSLAVLALVRLESATARGAGLIEETTVAQLVARNVALEALTDPQPPVPGRTDGSEANGGRTWNWIRQVSSAGEAGVMRIDVAVTNMGGQQVGRMTMIRPPGGPTQPATPPTTAPSAAPTANPIPGAGR